MKKLLLLAAMVSTMLAVAQDFPGENIELLSGKEITVMQTESNKKHGYQGFYTDSKLKKTYKGKSGFTEYTAVVGKTFKVVSFEPYTDNIGLKKYKITLTNAETGTLYLDYDTKYAHTFPFEVVGGLAYPEGFFCEKAYEKEIATANSRSYEFPFIDGVQLKYLKVENTFSMMSLTIRMPASKHISKDQVLRGVTLTLEDGRKLEFPDAKITSYPKSASESDLSAILSLVLGKNDKDIVLLMNNKVVKLKLNDYERDLKQGNILQEYIKCALK